jgi:integrase
VAYSGRTHQDVTRVFVPLAQQTVAPLHELRSLRGSDSSAFLFPSPSKEGFISNNTMLYALYRMGYHSRSTVHGFRAMASTALNEMGFRSDVIERQLAHQEQNAVRAAYNRAEYLAERRTMMQHWADHLDALAGENIVSLASKAAG